MYCCRLSSNKMFLKANGLLCDWCLSESYFKLVHVFIAILEAHAVLVDQIILFDGRISKRNKPKSKKTTFEIKGYLKKF